VWGALKILDAADAEHPEASSEVYDAEQPEPSFEHALYKIMGTTVFGLCSL